MRIRNRRVDRDFDVNAKDIIRVNGQRLSGRAGTRPNGVDLSVVRNQMNKRMAVKLEELEELGHEPPHGQSAKLTTEQAAKAERGNAMQTEQAPDAKQL